MARHNKFASTAAGSFSTYKPVGGNLYLRNDFRVHDPGMRYMNEAGCWVYIKNGTVKANPGDVLIFDELYGEDRPTGEGDNSEGSDGNGAVRVTSNPTNGALVRNAGVVVDVEFPPNTWGWVLCQGIAPVNIQWGTSAVTPNGTVGALAAAGRVGPFSAGASVISGIMLPELPAAGANNTNGQVVAGIQFPIWNAASQLSEAAFQIGNWIPTTPTVR